MDNDFAGFKPNSELRAEARAVLEESWLQAILTYIVYSVVEGAAASAAGIGNLIVGGPIELGLVGYFLRLKRRQDARIEDLFQGFQQFENSLVLYLVRTLYIVLWMLLLIIPGIVAAIRYSMAMYILHDNPELSGMEALRRSREMMEGNKLRLFELYLSFLGWGLLCIPTFGIGFLWLFPYIKMTEAGFYETLKAAERV
jgi:uncharacterized membrane protein